MSTDQKTSTDHKRMSTDQKRTSTDQGGGGGGGGDGDGEAEEVRLHGSALDALVSVNSYLTGAVFIGLAFSPANPSLSLAASKACRAPDTNARRLILFEVWAFAFYLLSTLIAHGLKIQLTLLNSSKPVIPGPLVPVNERLGRYAMMATALSTLVGTLFLTLAMVEVVELRLGLLSCPHQSGATWPLAAAIPLVACAFAGISTFAVTVVYAFLK